MGARAPADLARRGRVHARPHSKADETLARRGELVALEVRDIDFHPNGTDQALIRRGKTDAEGQGRVAYLSRETVKWVEVWLDHSSITEGVVFQRLIGEWLELRLRPDATNKFVNRTRPFRARWTRFLCRVDGWPRRFAALRHPPPSWVIKSWIAQR